MYYEQNRLYATFKTGLLVLRLIRCVQGCFSYSRYNHIMASQGECYNYNIWKFKEDNFSVISQFGMLLAH